MKVLVDTSVWSLALRRTTIAAKDIAVELGELTTEGRVEIVGAIRQELLSGVKLEAQYRALRDQLRAFPDLVVERDDFETAALCYNQCRADGIQGSNTDFLICAAAKRRGLSVFTTDNDFHAFPRVLGVRLHVPRESLN